MSGGVTSGSLGTGPQAGSRGGQQVVMFRIGTESFALDAGMVREIIDPIPATRVAGARPHIDRIVNVRGNVIPLADIRERFGMPAAADSPDTRFLVLEVAVGRSGGGRAGGRQGVRGDGDRSGELPGGAAGRHDVAP